MMGRNYRAELTGVFGDPVDGNPTGVMEEAGYEALSLNYRYITMKVTKEGFPDAMKAVRALNMRGVNLTMPHKITVLPWLDELSQAAAIIGAVNTVVGKGFVEALGRAGESTEGRYVTILGAGGAARAIAVECALAGAVKGTIINRTLSRAEELAALIREKTHAESAALLWEPGIPVPADTDILIQATPIGLAPDSDALPEIDYDTVTDQMVVSDVVFNPPLTRFLEEAGKHGAKTVSGLGMLACQGARNFTLWTGREAPLEIMENKLREEFIKQ